MQPRGKLGPTLPFGGVPTLGQIPGIAAQKIEAHRFRVRRRQDQHGGAGAQLEHPLARGGQVLGVVQSARPLLGQQELPVPMRFVPISSRAPDGDRRDAFVRVPNQEFAAGLGLESKGRVLVLQRMRITTGAKRPDFQRAARGIALERPAQHGRRISARDKDLLAQHPTARQFEHPSRPRIGRKSPLAVHAVRREQSRLVNVGRSKPPSPGRCTKTSQPFTSTNRCSAAPPARISRAW